jgi:hypothetical protein
LSIISFPIEVEHLSGHTLQDRETERSGQMSSEGDQMKRNPRRRGGEQAEK